MYQDTRQIKKHAIKISLDDDINEAVDEIVNKTGGQKSAIARKLLIEGLKIHESKFKEKPT